MSNAGSSGCGIEPKLKHWEPDFGPEKTWATDEMRWIAIRNLIISIPNLLLSFATWLVWSMIVAKIQKLHDKDPTLYNFDEWEGANGPKTSAE